MPLRQKHRLSGGNFQRPGIEVDGGISGDHEQSSSVPGELVVELRRADEIAALIATSRNQCGPNPNESLFSSFEKRGTKRDNRANIVSSALRAVDGSRRSWKSRSRSGRERTP
jgi:hypothetical protein